MRSAGMARVTAACRATWSLGKQHPSTFGMLLRGILPTQVTVEPTQPWKEYETCEDIKREMLELGMDIPEVLQLEYTAGDRLELEETDDADSKGG